VAKRYNQTKGLDCLEKFSPAIKYATIKVVFAHVIFAQWKIHQIDVNNTFLNGDMHENVYMQKPPDFVTSNSHLVFKLIKAVYNLKQAPRSWYQKLSITFQHFGFTFTTNDPSLFIRFTHFCSLFILIYM